MKRKEENCNHCKIAVQIPNAKLNNVIEAWIGPAGYTKRIDIAAKHSLTSTFSTHHIV